MPDRTCALVLKASPVTRPDGSRGGFGSSAFGGGTYGGTGYYCAVLGDMWDALLGEGRNWYLFASSDWHSRGDYVFDDPSPATTGDFWPGQYQKDYVYVENSDNPTARDVVDALRDGNSYIVQGDLIDKLYFIAAANGKTATMGQNLEVKAGETVQIAIWVRDPQGSNNCPYTFANPSLAQVGTYQPLDQPQLHHVDLIAGNLTGYVAPIDADYTNPTNPSTAIVKRFARQSTANLRNGWMIYQYSYIAQAGGDQYFRLRGTNLPANTPNETDAVGNPLLDTLATENISYKNPETGETVALNNDVEAWADLWFYSNPINVYVTE